MGHIETKRMRLFALTSIFGVVFAVFILILSPNFSHAQTGLCKNNDGIACLNEGREALNKEKDAKKAFKLFEKGCEANNGASCLELGLLIEAGTVTKKDTNRAKELALRACELKDSTACFVVAHAYEKGNGAFEKSVSKSNDYYYKSCEYGELKACKAPMEIDIAKLSDQTGKSDVAIKAEKECLENNFESCNKVGSYYLLGLNVPKNLQTSASFFKKACDGDFNFGCRNLGLAYENGNGVAKDINKALDYYKTACQKKAGGGCYDAGRIYDNGTEVTRNQRLAIMLYIDACDLKNDKACTRLTQLPQNEVEKEKREKAAHAKWLNAKNGCDANNAEDCSQAAINFYTGNYEIKNFNKAFELSTKACNLNSQIGCANLGHFYLMGIGTEKSNIDYYNSSKKACDLGGIYAGCQQLAEAYFYGRGIETSFKEAEIYFQKSCNVNNAISCNYLGRIYDEGLGFLKSRTKAQANFEKACNINKNVGEACSRAINLRALAN